MSLRREMQRRVEAEFGEPFWDVLRGFAAAGYSRADTANIIGACLSAFRRLLLRHPEHRINWPDPYKCNSFLESRKNPSAATLAHIRELALARRVQVTADGITAPIEEHMARVRSTVSKKTVVLRIKSGMPVGEALRMPPRVGRGRPTQSHVWRRAVVKQKT